MTQISSARRPRVLVLAAVEAEMEPFRRRLGRLLDLCEPSLVVTGVGKATAAISATTALAEGPCAFALQIGVAGALPSSMLALGDVVIATSEFLADEGVEAPEGFLNLDALGLPGAVIRGAPLFNEIPVCVPRPGALASLVERTSGRYAVRPGRLATVSTGSGTDARAAEVERRSSALAESMEGAAAALAALHRGTPFFEVRGISNRAGERQRDSWRMGPAAEHAAEAAALIMEAELGRV